MLIFNSKTATKEVLEPLGETVKIYVCGPTVYDHAHLGHARSALSFDLLVRTLKALGFETFFARNITDVDDKIIKKMNETGKPLQEITEFYYQSYKSDLSAIGCLPPDIEPKATENIEEMALMVQILLDKGFAYRTSSGDIYFDVSKDKDYMSLSHRKSDDLQSRLDGESGKKDTKDFVLWKAKNENDTLWFDTALGQGRPGWHLECSAMIHKHLAWHGEFQIDIHGGGSDLLFPHHENECAQSRCAYGGELSKIWMHNGFVTINSEKMSKSLGNGFSLNEAVALFGGEYVRNYLIQTHYRQNFNFSHDDLIASKKRLDRIYRLKKRIMDAADTGKCDDDLRKSLLEALSNDMNISEALALLEDFITKANERLDSNQKDKDFKSSIKATLVFVEAVLGLGYKNPTEHFQQGVNDKEKENINSLIIKRSEAKVAKDFTTADNIRQRLLDNGIAIMDTANGTVWEKI